MKKGIIIAGIAAAVFYAGITIYKQVALLKQTCYSVAGHQIISVTQDSINIIINLKVKNLSNVDITLKNYNFNIYLNNSLVAKVYSNDEQVIAKNDFSILNLAIDFNPKTTLGDLTLISGIVLNYNNTLVTIDGNVTTKIGMFNVNVPIHIESALKDMVGNPVIDVLGPNDCV